jgi:hypothetical protein
LFNKICNFPVSLLPFTRMWLLLYFRTSATNILRYMTMMLLKVIIIFIASKLLVLQQLFKIEFVQTMSNIFIYGLLDSQRLLWKISVNFMHENKVGRYIPNRKLFSTVVILCIKLYGNNDVRIKVVSDKFCVCF